MEQPQPALRGFSGTVRAAVRTGGTVPEPAVQVLGQPHFPLVPFLCVLPAFRSGGFKTTPTVHFAYSHNRSVARGKQPQRERVRTVRTMRTVFRKLSQAVPLRKSLEIRCATVRMVRTFTTFEG